MNRTWYTVAWGHYTYNSKGKIISQVEDGDKELFADSKEDAIKEARVPANTEWNHVYAGPSKWL